MTTANSTQWMSYLLAPAARDSQLPTVSAVSRAKWALRCGIKLGQSSSRVPTNWKHCSLKRDKRSQMVGPFTIDIGVALGKQRGD